MEESAKSLDQQSNSNTSPSPKLEEHVDNHNHNCDHLDHQQHQHQHQHPHLQHQHQHQQHLHHAAEGEGHHFHKDANVEHGSVLENHPHHLHHSPEEASAHHQHAHDAQQAALTSNMQHGGHYPPLTNEQLQAINTNPSVAQAHALQQQIQQHLQQQLQSPFPFAYQTPLPPLPPAGGMPQGLAGGVEDAQQIKARPKRKQVKSACLNCRKRKTGCDAFRPCTKCTRNGLESTCVDVPRKKRSSNRAKTNATVTPLSAGSSSPSPSSSPALGVAPSPAPTFASPLSSQLQYMSVNMGQGCIPTSNGIPMPQQTQYSPQLIPMTWGAPNGAQTHYVPMTWEEITKHVASAQNNGGPGNVPLQLPQELAWKGSEGLGQPGMTPVEQSK